MKNILVVGSLNMDMVITTQRLPKLGETLIGSDFKTVCGGKGANQATALGKMGASVAMLGAVGADIYGSEMIRNLESCGVNAGRVQTVSTSSGVAVITVCGGDNHIIINAGANGHVTEAMLEENKALFKWADLVILQFEIPMQSVEYAAKLAHKYNARVLLNPAPMQKLSSELIELTDIFVPNSHEAGDFLGMEIKTDYDAETAVTKLLELGINQIIITLGSKGCIYNDGNEIKRQNSIAVPVVDTTAAGDSFIGGFATALCEGKSITDAISFATAVSAITVSKVGASVSIPNRKEVDDFIKERKSQ